MENDKEAERKKRIALANAVIQHYGSCRKAGSVFGISGAAVCYWTRTGIPKKYVREAQLRNEIDKLNKTISKLKMRLSAFEGMSA